MKVKTKEIIISALMFLAALTVQAQVTPTPKVEPRINISGNVFGGARQAEVNGKANVTIHGGSDAADLIAITGVFGGNDISGTVVGGATVTTDGDNQLFVGQLFGGGNGDYDYTTTYAGKSKPELTNAEIDLQAGTFGYVYGGGNAATVTNSAIIKVNISETKTPLDIAKTDTDDNDDPVGDADDLFTASELQAMGINTDNFDRKGNYHISRLFGGNNKAAMDIRPTWNLTKGSIENLYSGGNAGDMTYSGGISLSVDGEGMTVHNVYGGCRKADVHQSASVTINNGNIDYVYGGNDISGTVRQGTRVEIKSTINHDVYGGSNGSYLYTNSDASSDFFFSVPTGKTAAEALTNHRPNVPSTSVLLQGTKTHPVSIGGAVYCGGNSATLKKNSEFTGTTPTATLTLGSYVMARKVFMGCNGEDMVKPATLTAFSSTLG
ncbi:MAG: hypothetical protein IK075_09445, partial [Prevotella sp.]|nr:hypothetical protein [Prevotella sp.]